MSDLAGKAALVTGASRGVGLAVVRKFSALGVRVALAARTENAIRQYTEELVAAGGSAIAIPCDVASFADVRRAVDQTVEAFGGLDILVNNAGVVDPIARLSESDPEEWGRAVDINLKGVYHGLRAAIPVMENAGGGVVVNMSSGAAASALEGWSQYCATKAAAKKLTECAHGEAADRSVRVVGLSPGTVATDMMARIKASGVNPVSRLDWSSHIPPEWAAEAVAFLCGPGGAPFAGSDFSLKTQEGRRLVGLPTI